MYFDYSHSILRTDSNFRQHLQDEHHKTTSPLEKLPIDKIKDIPLDYMHLILLGVVKKIIKIWIKGSANFQTKLSVNFHII